MLIVILSLIIFAILFAICITAPMLLPPLPLMKIWRALIKKSEWHCIECSWHGGSTAQAGERPICPKCAATVVWDNPPK